MEATPQMVERVVSVIKGQRVEEEKSWQLQEVVKLRSAVTTEGQNLNCTSLKLT